uniref:Uncharacterized protein n=1 Tax=Chrysemys picta bellii TaxID=8478 RepID=A0A8C3HLP0_CHRPI
ASARELGPPAWGGPWKGLLLAASVLGSCLQPAPAQTPVTIVLTPPSPVVGGGVSLAPQPPPQDLLTCNWYRSATVTDPNSLILTYVQYPNPAQNNGPAHTGRETAGPGCALNMAGLMLNYTGNYTVQIQSSTAANPVRSTVVLRVSGKCHPGSCADPICAPPPTAIPAPAMGLWASTPGMSLAGTWGNPPPNTDTVG